MTLSTSIKLVPVPSFKLFRSDFNFGGRSYDATIGPLECRVDGNVRSAPWPARAAAIFQDLRQSDLASRFSAGTAAGDRLLSFFIFVTETTRV